VFIGEGDVGLASILFFIANLGVSGSIVFYDSLLPHVAKADETDRVSSAGYAMGYIGGGLLLLINLAWILQPATFGFSGTVPAIKASFFAVAGWWAGFSLPFFRTVKEPHGRAPHAGESGIAIVAAFARLATTFHEVRKYRNAFLLFIAMLLYQDGIQTIIRMAGVYGAEVGVEQTSQIAAFVMVQFLGIPFSFLFGSLGVRIGTKRPIFTAIPVYAMAAGPVSHLSLSDGSGEPDGASSPNAQAESGPRPSPGKWGWGAAEPDIRPPRTEPSLNLTARRSPVWTGHSRTGLRPAASRRRGAPSLTDLSRPARCSLQEI